MSYRSHSSSFLSLAVVAVLLITVLVVRWHIHSTAYWAPTDVEPDKWVQPAAVNLNSSYSQAISLAPTGLDFSRFETLLWQVRLGPQDELIINDELERLLAQLANDIPQTLTESERQRLQFLIIKSFPATAGSDLAKLTQQYLRYHRALQNSNARKDDETTDAAQHRILQQQYFAPQVAVRLFERKNHTLDYLYQRRRVMLDPTLTQEQKRKRLEQLQREHRTRLTDQQRRRLIHD